ncbi:hypothetical protein [Agromyces arachidis]|uniref:hypothetical protein n=1 Tax=Agromyces arachidis TaxID=766966 RepID=UPI0040573DC6
MKTALAALALAMASVPLLAGCSIAQRIDDVAGPEVDQIDEVPAPAVEEDPVPPAAPVEVDEPAAPAWVCTWAPTMNEDWHDDYLCTNGVDSDRPYLIPEDDFVERWEIDQAAAAYQAVLNS